MLRYLQQAFVVAAAVVKVRREGGDYAQTTR